MTEEGGKAWVQVDTGMVNVIWIVCLLSLASWKAVEILLWALSHVRIT
jgi:hypothetical protein